MSVLQKLPPELLGEILGDIVGRRTQRKAMPPLKDDDELAAFIKDRFGVLLPNKSICANHTTPFRALADAYFARFPTVVWKASRGFGGKTYTLALLSMLEALTLGSDVSLLGGSGEQSKRVLEHLAEFWKSPKAPKEFLVSDIARETKFLGGNKIIALMASQTSVRGPHPQRLRLDECLAEGTLITTKRGGIPIECVKSGEQILQFDGVEYTWGVVSAATEKGMRETIEVKFSDGGDLVCTAEHKIFTEHGWQYAKYITTTTRLQKMWSQPNAWQNRQNARCTRFMSKLLERKAAYREVNEPEPLSGLWRNQRQKQSRMPALCVQNTCQNINLLSQLWQANQFWLQALQKMFVAICFFSQRQFAIDSGQSQFATELLQSTGKRRYGGVWDSWAKIRISSPDWEIYRRFSIDRLQHYRGVARRLLVQSRRQNSAKIENGVHLFAGIRDYLFAAFKETSLVQHLAGGGRTVTVVATKSFGKRRVFDLTTEPYHNFIANGVIVHNCDEMSLEVLDAALGQPMSRNGVISQIVQSSTHQYADGTMTKCLERAAQGGYPVYEWCYRETLVPHGWLLPEDLERKRLQMTSGSWNNEVELQEPNPESRAIQPAAVEKMFKRELGVFSGAMRELIEIEQPRWKCAKCKKEYERKGECADDKTPLTAATYATGADWGKSVDWTIICTLRTDVRPMRVVAWMRMGREDWPVMIGEFNRRIMKYEGGAAHDATGLGNVVTDLLQSGVLNVVMVGRDRADLLTEYITAIERGEIESPHIEFAKNEHKQASRAAVYTQENIAGTSRQHLPDSISAGALTYRAAIRGRFQIF